MNCDTEGKKMDIDPRSFVFGIMMGILIFVGCFWGASSIAHVKYQIVKMD